MHPVHLNPMRMWYKCQSLFYKPDSWRKPNSLLFFLIFRRASYIAKEVYPIDFRGMTALTIFIIHFLHSIRLFSAQRAFCIPGNLIFDGISSEWKLRTAGAFIILAVSYTLWWVVKAYVIMVFYYCTMMEWKGYHRALPSCVW